MFKVTEYGNHIVWAHNSVKKHVRTCEDNNEFLIKTFYKELKTPLLNVTAINIREKRTSKLVSHGSPDANG